MGAYLLKRLLLAFPTIWLIGSIVFLLSRVIPGTYADLQQENEQTISGISITDSRTKYLQELKASGLDKPLFYFSLHSQAESDTLARVFPVRHQQFLITLVHQYGNWPAIASYYKSLVQLQQKVNNSQSEILQEENIQRHIRQLFILTDERKINKQLDELLILLAAHSGSNNIIEPLKETKEKLMLLVQEANSYKNLVPRLQWHGTNNQYHLWLQGFIRADLGVSYRDGQPVINIIGEAIGNTLLLLVSSLFLIFVLAIELSLWLSRKKSAWRSVILTSLYMLDSVPLFIVALLLLTFLAGSGYLNLFPVFGLSSGIAGNTNIILAFFDKLHHLILPAICLLLAGLPYVTTQLYQTMQQVLHSEYITTAKAKGLSQNLVLRRHVFRNAFLPLITLFTGYLPGLISGALVVEVIFAISGTGRLLAESVLARDYPVVLGLVLFAAVVKIVSHLLADFLYFKADPRTGIN